MDTSFSGEQTDDSTTPEEAFALLGNETRLAVLRTIWSEADHGEAGRDGVLPFSAIREALGVDSGNLNYHLDRLVGTFIERVDGGYRLRQAGKNVVRAVVAGTITADPSYGPVGVDTACPRCGSRLETRYRREYLYAVCSACSGGLRSHADHPEGTLGWLRVPPAGLRGRTPQEVLDAAHRRFSHMTAAMLDGVCPTCAGTVSPTLSVCSDHRFDGEELCPACLRAIPALARVTCDVCSQFRGVPPIYAVLAEPTLVAAFEEAGVHLFRSWGEAAPPSRWPFEVVEGDRPRVEYDLTLPTLTGLFTVSDDLTVAFEPAGQTG
ncbi:winged helix-turn-helix domain-containing protein [Halomarina ordinaria]|uniref:Winged helix-turn-helix domain-containing protein n=1 Tax=Halomarina ordinaria TaxID=3033939 RepID=A0ABD5UBK0_9EURY|nr:helix-turn-helix domain-containing protein [Halomarina sp. PSRA2]